MMVERLARPAMAAPKVSSPTTGLGQVFACLWWLVRAHMADSSLMPRDVAVTPPPVRWLRGWPRR